LFFKGPALSFEKLEQGLAQRLANVERLEDALRRCRRNIGAGGLLKLDGANAPLFRRSTVRHFRHLSAHPFRTMAAARSTGNRV
jgi:hypothetical protein